MVVALLLASAAGQSPAPSGAAPIWRHEVVRSFPHDSHAFTQGLVFRDGFLYESTGRNGESSLRKVEIETGKVVQRLGLGRQYFAEGLAAWGTQLRAAHVGHQHRLRLRPRHLQAAADVHLPR